MRTESFWALSSFEKRIVRTGKPSRLATLLNARRARESSVNASLYFSTLSVIGQGLLKKAEGLSLLHSAESSDWLCIPLLDMCLRRLKPPVCRRSLTPRACPRSTSQPLFPEEGVPPRLLSLPFNLSVPEAQKSFEHKMGAGVLDLDERDFL